MNLKTSGLQLVNLIFERFKIYDAEATPSGASHFIFIQLNRFQLVLGHKVPPALFNQLTMKSPTVPKRSVQKSPTDMIDCVTLPKRKLDPETSHPLTLDF